MSEWISTKTELPPKNQNVLLYVGLPSGRGKAIWIGSRFWSKLLDSECWEGQEINGWDTLTHQHKIIAWMPIPEPPEENE